MTLGSFMRSRIADFAGFSEFPDIRENAASFCRSIACHLSDLKHEFVEVRWKRIDGLEQTPGRAGFDRFLKRQEPVCHPRLGRRRFVRRVSTRDSAECAETCERSKCLPQRTASPTKRPKKGSSSTPEESEIRRNLMLGPFEEHRRQNPNREKQENSKPTSYDNALARNRVNCQARRMAPRRVSRQANPSDVKPRWPRGASRCGRRRPANRARSPQQKNDAREEKAPSARVASHAAWRLSAAEQSCACWRSA